MKTKQYLLVSLAILIASGISYRLGTKQMMSAFDTSLQATQTKLAFNKLRRYEEISTCLSKGKQKEAAIKVKNSIISEKELIAKFLNSFNDPGTKKYIEIRYPNGVESLRAYKSERGRVWSEPSCR